MQIQLTRNALEAMTTEQKSAILRLTESDDGGIEITKEDPFGLPPDYLAFHLQYVSGTHIYGGIGSDGSVST